MLPRPASREAGVARPHEPEERLVRAAVGGDREAIALLLARLRPIVLRYCLGQLGGGHGYAGAEDCAQEVLLAVFAGLPRYRHDTSKFLPYVFGIAAHKVADARRSKARDPSAPTADPDPGARSGADDPTLEDVERADGLGRISALLDGLAPRPREVLVLRIVLGFSAEETATALGISSAGAVRVMQHRALTELRQVLRGGGRPRRRRGA
ncbi:sigma-70 family RNA polymerase sigma factor [Amycolatopsis samaneae]|uniref:Sigma-70 family RNA polymerase sigma factor n=1 Tax=Amycolatopsis samaneae TaxID=664691 RepID=A0ABW5GT00_9PSEU